MDFNWTPEQNKLKQQVIQFAQRELTSDVIKLDKEERFDYEAWQKCSELGLHGLTIPKEYGGRGLDILTAVCVLEGLGYGCQDNGLIFAINAHLWACATPLLTFGSDAQKEQYLSKFSRGEWIGGHAITEAESGSDVYAMQATAKQQGEHYILNGRKTYVCNGDYADLIIVFANLDPDGRKQGVTAFLVEKNTPGLTLERHVSKMGVRTAMTGQITLEDCAIPLKNRLGKEGAGVTIFAHSMEWERGFILASAVGTMQRLLEDCIRYARTRKQFGQSIGKFQLISEKLVEMKMRLETARAYLYKVAWLKSNRRMAVMEAAMAKLYISEAWVQTCLDAMQIHGGHGYLTESGLERQLRDALGSRIYSGTSEIQKTIISQFLGV